MDDRAGPFARSWEPPTYFPAPDPAGDVQLRTVGLALAAGVAALLVVGVIGTELGTAAGIEFSLFLGIPAGFLAGVAAAAVVFLRLEDPEPSRRRPAIALAGFGVAFLVVLLLAVGAFRLRNSVALPIAAVGGFIGAAVAYLRGT